MRLDLYSKVSSFYSPPKMAPESPHNFVSTDLENNLLSSCNPGIIIVMYHVVIDNMMHMIT